MSPSSRPDEPTPRGWSEEDLLELLLEGRGGELEQARRDPDTAARLAELESFLDRWREPLASAPTPLSPMAERRLVQRVLARTTRLDAGWRGDAALVLRFVYDRLAASPALRVAAAVLLLQVLALPVLAWIVWSEPERPTPLLVRVENEVIEPFLPATPETSLEDLALEPPLEELRPARIAPLPEPSESRTALRAAARDLRASTWPDLSRDVGEDGLAVGRLLAARAALCDLPSASDAEVQELLARASRGEASGVVRAMRAELLLDRLALTGQEPEELAGVLASLGNDAREPAAVRHLEALAIERARTYGCINALAWSRLANADAPPGSRGTDPLDGAWRAALRRALESDESSRAALEDATLRHWLGAASGRR